MIKSSMTIEGAADFWCPYMSTPVDRAPCVADHCMLWVPDLIITDDDPKRGAIIPVRDSETHGSCGAKK